MTYYELDDKGNPTKPIKRPQFFVLRVIKTSMCVEPYLKQLTKEFLFDANDDEFKGCETIEMFRDQIEENPSEQICGDDAYFFSYLTRKAYDNNTPYEQLWGWSDE